MDHSPAALVMSRTKWHIVTSQQAPGPGSYEPNYKTIVKTENGFKIGGSLKIANHAGKCQYFQDLATTKQTKVLLLRITLSR